MSGCDGDKKRPVKQPKKQAKETGEIKHSSRNKEKQMQGEKNESRWEGPPRRRRRN